MRETVDLSHYVTLAPDGAARIELAVEGIDCAGCINRIEQAIIDAQDPRGQSQPIVFRNDKNSKRLIEGELKERVEEFHALP